MKIFLSLTEPLQVMASGKDRGRDQCDESKDDGEITTITNTLQQIEKLRITDQNIQWSQVDQRHGENEELDDNQ